RGMLESASLTSAVFLRHGQRLAKLIPLAHLALIARENVDELARSAVLAGLTDLNLGLNVDADTQRGFYAAFDPPGLRRLSISPDWIGYFDHDPLADWPGLARLTSLEVTSLNLGSLLASPHLGWLERLALNGRQMGDGRALARSEKLAGLRELEVSS